MRVVIQRVKSASVTVDGEVISSIGKGILILAGVSRDDTEKDIDSMSRKILKTKFWDDDTQDPPARWKSNVQEIKGEVLCVSQFTLHASLKKGNKPDFHESASGEKARTLYQAFFDKMGELYDPQKVKNGQFAAMMDVALVNDGPVTIQLDTNPTRLDTKPAQESNP